MDIHEGKIRRNRFDSTDQLNGVLNSTMFTDKKNKAVVSLIYLVVVNSHVAQGSFSGGGLHLYAGRNHGRRRRGGHRRTPPTSSPLFQCNLALALTSSPWVDQQNLAPATVSSPLVDQPIGPTSSPLVSQPNLALVPFSPLDDRPNLALVPTTLFPDDRQQLVNQPNQALVTTTPSVNQPNLALVPTTPVPHDR